MDADEWCAVAHVDISPRGTLERGVELLEMLAAEGGSAEGVIDLAVLRQPVRQNHFEIIGRYSSEEAYQAHLAGEANLAFRTEIAPMLGSPYEDRLHRPRGEQRFPAAAVGDFLVVTQLELRPAALADADGAIAELAGSEAASAGHLGQVCLERRGRPNNVELVSVWSSEEAFTSYLADASAGEVRRALATALVAPVDDRLHHLLAGSLSAS